MTSLFNQGVVEVKRETRSEHEKKVSNRAKSNKIMK